MLNAYPYRRVERFAIREMTTRPFTSWKSVTPMILVLFVLCPPGAAIAAGLPLIFLRNNDTWKRRPLIALAIGILLWAASAAVGVIIPGVSNCVSPSSCPGVRPVRPGAPSEGCTCRDRSGRAATRGCCAACGVHMAGRACPCARFYARGHAGAYAGAAWVGKVRLSMRSSVGAAGKDGA